MRAGGTPRRCGAGGAAAGRGQPAGSGAGAQQQPLLSAVSPSVRLLPEPSSVELNRTLNLSCLVEGFYPREVAVSWLENGRELKAENSSRAVRTPRGLFRLSSLLEVQATEERNGSVLACRVLHDGQEPLSRTLTLWVAVPAKEGMSGWDTADNGAWALRSLPGKDVSCPPHPGKAQSPTGTFFKDRESCD